MSNLQGSYGSLLPLYVYAKLIQLMVLNTKCFPKYSDYDRSKKQAKHLTKIHCVLFANRYRAKFES